jgi:hypothetical protein
MTLFDLEESKMKTIEILKCLANGIDPETGEELPKDSIAHKPETIRAFYSLVDELSNRQVGSKKKPTEAEKIQKNIEMGKPQRSNLSWSEEERAELTSLFNSKYSIEDLSEKLQRTSLAIATQLENMGLITKEKTDQYRGKNVQAFDL